MTDYFSGSVPDDVPVADALEQTVEPAPDEDQNFIVGDVPLETSESDWQDQQLVVEDPEEDFR